MAETHSNRLDSADKPFEMLLCVNQWSQIYNYNLSKRLGQKLQR